VGIAALYSGYQYYHLHKTPGALKDYQSMVIVQIGLQSTTKATDQSYADYVSASETLADEYTTGPLFTMPEFDNQVLQQIQTDKSLIEQRYGPDLGDLTPSAIGNALSATRAHSLVTVTATWATQAGAWAIANAVGEVTVKNIDSYIGYVIGNGSTPGAARATPAAGSSTGNLVQPPVEARVVSQATDPVIIAGPLANRPALLLALVLVALVIGIALAFLIEYLDDRIRSRDDVIQVLQLPVYGEVPRSPVPRQNHVRR
jgi:capsular polysaccharide biosynthesis protein